MRRILCIILLIITLSVPALAQSGNMLENPAFENVDGALPEGWYRDSWIADAGVTYYEVESTEEYGNCIRISNMADNDARLCQDVAVEPGALYAIRCMVKAEGIDENGIGANISILNTFSYSQEVFDTNGEWRELTLYGRTGENQTSLTVCARVGGYSGITTGTAWFDEFEMQRIDSLPAGATALSLATNLPSASVDSDEADAEPARYTETWLLACLGIALAFTALYRRRERFTGDIKRGWIIFACVLGAAFVIRLVIAFMVRGYHTDITCFTSWGERMYALGPVDFYTSDYFCDYPPIYMALLAAASFLRELLGITPFSTGHVALVKLIPIIFDLGLATLIFAYARKLSGMKLALLAAVLCALNPAAIVDSAAWGQIDSVFTFFTVLAALLLTKGAYMSAVPMIAIGILIKPQTLLFAPLGLIALIIDILRSDDRKRALVRAGAGVAIALAVMLLAALIFHERGTNPIEWLVSLYSGTMSGYPKVTVNAFNLYQIFDLNWAELSEHPVVENAAWICFAFAYLFAGFTYFMAKRRSALFISAASLIMFICAFGPMIHERYVYPALALLVLAYAVERDWRIIISLAIVTITLFMNQLLVLQGGMTAANYGHLHSSEAWINSFMSVMVVLNALFTAYVAFDIAVLKHRMEPAAEEPAAPRKKPALFEARDWKLNLKRVDYILMAAVTVAYSVLTFTNLGTLSAPQSTWVATQSGESVVFDLGQTRTYRMEYYGNICNTTFTVEISNDGESWTEPVYAEYDQSEIFRWKFFVPLSDTQSTLYNEENIAADGTQLTYASARAAYPFQTSRYVRISAVQAGLALMEVGFIDENGEPYPAGIAGHSGYHPDYVSDPGQLLDEQETVPEYPTYLNSTYFDEIYHARTAYEHLNGLQTYEWTHPPLGKVLMMIGIKLFGMTPFGWRFMGALMGVLMVPLIYLMAKQLGASTKVSALAMLLMTLDSMHFTQTRIATIDSYAVFFIMLMYLFMIRYVKMSFNRQPLWRTLIPLMLCGITMGVSWATKWIGFYASAGLAIMFFWSFLQRFVEYLRARGSRTKSLSELCRSYWPKALITTGVCLVFFVAIPLLIYYFSYYWHMQYEGGLTLQRVYDLQFQIFDYHAGLGDDTHYFRSPWYEWPVIAWPIWFYKGTQYLAEGVISSISCMGNPAVWWAGLAAMLGLLGWSAWKKRADWAGLIIIIGFLSQYLPWVLVPRSTFIYHYFASVPFIILATAYMLSKTEKYALSSIQLSLRDEKRALSISVFDVCACVLVIAALTLFIMFYPLESGLPMSDGYARHLRWFNWYNY